MSSSLVTTLKHQFPLLPLKLKQAGMNDEPDEFIKKILTVSAFMSIGALIVIGGVLNALGASPLLIIMTCPIIFTLMFMYMMNMPDMYALKRQREMDREIVFMGRYLILQLEAGIPIYNAMKNIAMNYEHSGKFFKEILDWIDMGTPMEDALNEGIVISPSPNMVRILWQILNTIKTGSDIKVSLINVLDQITREQTIALKEYGKKLNPLAMMYMVMAIIFPSLGVTILVIISAFLSINMNLIALLVLAGMLGFMQFMFFNIIRSQRPAVDL